MPRRSSSTARRWLACPRASYTSFSAISSSTCPWSSPAPSIRRGRRGACFESICSRCVRSLGEHLSTFQRVKATPFNHKTIDEFHAKKGRGVGMWGDHVLLMTARGAKSGEAITTPLVCGREGDNYIVVGSKGGAPTHPTWLGNIKANPDVEVEVANDTGTETFKARARVVESRQERDRLYKEMTKIWPAFADYQARTERLIPVIVLERQRGEEPKA